jgi:Zn-finger protein
MAESGKWSCKRCQWERLHQLEEKLENALQEILHRITHNNTSQTDILPVTQHSIRYAM